MADDDKKKKSNFSLKKAFTTAKKLIVPTIVLATGLAVAGVAIGGSTAIASFNTAAASGEATKFGVGGLWEMVKEGGTDLFTHGKEAVAGWGGNSIG